MADAEGIEVSDEEIEEQVRADAEATGRAPERLLHDLQHHGGWETLRQDLRLKQAVEVLTAGATPIPMAAGRGPRAALDPRRRPRAGEQAETAGKPAAAGKLWTPGDPR